MAVRYIPEYIDPFRFAEQNLGLDGIVNLADMPRLSATIPATENHVTTSLTFGRDEQGVVYLKGHIEAVVPLQCQRCLEPYNYEIISDFTLGIVNTLDEANALPEHYEPALTSEGQLALRELIEDEIILNLPIIPKHEPDTCKVQLPYHDAGWDEGKDKNKNPFQVLENLKRKS